MRSAEGVFQLYIDGEWVGNQSGESFAVYDPSTEEEMARVFSAGPFEVDLAVQAARRAFDGGPWPQKTPLDRAQILFRLAAKVREQLASLAEVEARNSGKPIVEAEGDIAAVAEVFEYYAGLATKIPGQVNPVGVAKILRVEVGEDDGLCAIGGHIWWTHFGGGTLAGDAWARWRDETVLEALLHGGHDGLTERDKILRCGHRFEQ